MGSLHGRHVKRVEQLGVSIQDRVDEIFRALPSAVEQVDSTCAESVKRGDRRTRGASCADDETALDIVQGRSRRALMTFLIPIQSVLSPNRPR